MNDLQDHYGYERQWEDRCPRCGSPEGGHNDYYLLDDGDELWCGWSCRVCLFDSSCDTVYQDAPFIMPSDAGSHDRLADYDPPE